MAALDLTGQRFGRLIVIKRSTRKRTEAADWQCRCDCGKKVLVSSKLLRGSYTRSCGCLHRDTSRARWTIHGMARTPLYKNWFQMKARCQSPKNKAFPRYGGRGIKVCTEWQAFEPFRRWATSNGYVEGLTIDRIDNDGDYEPANCQWITRSENVRKGSLVRWANR